ncbi:MAG: hypothetical protein ACQSGP_05000 [Frankia sp.]
MAAAIEIRDAEERIRRAVHDGKQLRDARVEFGYHSLQTARSNVYGG